jgi:hypothetical protein
MSCIGDEGGGTGGSGINSEPVVVFGTVSGFGSIVVNGITFDTANATITLNGQPGSEADLQLGHVVTVQGTRDLSSAVGIAETVAFESNAEGPIDSINPATNSLVVLGQIVVVGDTTQFGDTPFNALDVGNIVELSGFVDTNGVLRATRVDRTQDAFIPGIEIETSGTIANLDVAIQIFTLNMLTVDFSAAQLINLPGNQLLNGQVVEVTSSQNVVNGVLVADRVEVQNVGIQGDAGEEAEIEGIITSVTSVDAFEVNGQPVRITSDTVFQGGMAGDIAVNVRVEVEGVFNADGILVVEEVEFEADSLVEIEGTIISVTSADTFVVGGQSVRITSDTRFEMGTVDDIVVGTQLQVEGFFNADGTLVATRVEFFADIAGIITSVTSADTFEVDGHPVRITLDTLFDGGMADDIAINVRVEVEGLFDEHGVLVAIAIEFL